MITYCSPHQSECFIFEIISLETKNRHEVIRHRLPFFGDNNLYLARRTIIVQVMYLFYCHKGNINDWLLSDLKKFITKNTRSLDLNI